MRTAVFSTELLRSFLDEHKIATLSELKETLGTKVDMTVFRKLRELTYRTSSELGTKDISRHKKTSDDIGTLISL